MEFEEGNIYFTEIIVIQSIPEEERKTGTEIYDDIISRRAWKDPNLKTDIINVENKREILHLLESIKRKTKEKESIPFIHFETHGTKKGISLSSNEEIFWKDIIPILRSINIYSENNLFISVSSCWGGNIQFEIEIGKPCPFREFIGPMNKIKPNDLLISFTNFFNELLISDDFEKAINQLNIYNISGVKFHHLNSESFFKIILDNHKNMYRKNSTVHDERLKSLTDSLWMKSNPLVKERYKTKEKFMEAVKRFEESELPKSYNRLRNIFLHIK